MVLLAAWLAVTTVSHAGANHFVLEVPATYLSVGQQFEPELVSQAANAAVPAAEITLTLRDAGGERLAGEQLTLDGAATVAGLPLSLPHAGAFTLHASTANGTQTIAMHALPDPSPDYGGVLPVAGVGVAAGVAEYLSQHGFAMEELGPAAAPRLVLVGDPRLDGGDLLGEYGQLWKAVAAGVPALLLEPPPPGVAAAWPLAPPLVAPQGDCSEDLQQAPLGENLAFDAGLGTLLRPELSLDLSQQNGIDLYHWDGRRLARPNDHTGYSGCHALISFRFGQGWVTVSTLPLLQHFQDVRARIYLMNLMRAAAWRKRAAPASPGLAWILQQRLKSLAATAPLSAAAVYYRPPPAATAPAPRVVEAATDQDGNSCWSAPADTAPGATLMLDLRRPQPVHQLTLAFSAWPADFHLEASPDGAHWSPLPAPAPPTTGALELPLPAGNWQAFRLTLTAAGAMPPWRVCQFTAQ